MGVRIDIFAMDEGRFAEYLKGSIRSPLRNHLEHGKESNPALYFWDTSRSVEIAALPRKRFWIRSLIAPFEMRDATWDDLKDDLFLSKSLHDYIKSESDIWLSMFLRHICSCSNVAIIRELSSGYRRWWIGSMFQAARNIASINQSEHEVVARLFQRMLRGYDCGIPLPAIDWKPYEECFPAIPAESSQMSVWSASETKLVLDFIHNLLTAAPSFKKPPGEIGIAVDTDDEWNDWVRGMLQQLLAIEKLDFTHPKLVSFIG